MGLNQRQGGKTYAKLLSDGSLRVKCDESTEGAKKREYELADGTKNTVYELVYDSLTGLITSLEIEEGQFGEQMRLTISDNGEEIIVTTGASSNFADDMMKKLPNLDLSKSVELKPYAFTDDKGKSRKGVSFYQDDKKIDKFDFEEMPKLPEDAVATFKKKDWKKYFEGVNEFLIDYTLNVTVLRLPKLVTDVEFN